MRKLLLVALPLGLALLAGVMLSNHLQTRDDAAESSAERLRLKREFDERAALVRALPPQAGQEWRDEVNVLLRGYFQAVSEIRNRYPRAPSALSALETAEAEKKGKLADKDRAIIEDFQQYADSRLALLSRRRLRPRRLGAGGRAPPRPAGGRAGRLAGGRAGASHRLRALGSAAAGGARAAPGRRPSPARRCPWR